MRALFLLILLVISTTSGANPCSDSLASEVSAKFDQSMAISDSLYLPEGQVSGAADYQADLQNVYEEIYSWADRESGVEVVTLAYADSSGQVYVDDLDPLNLSLRSASSEGDPTYPIPRIKIRSPKLGESTGEQLKPKHLVFTAGVHGNESIGIVTLVKFAHWFLKQSQLRQEFELTIYPVLNPGAVMANIRKLEIGDLNRNFLIGSNVPLAHLLMQDFDIVDGEMQIDGAFDLHEAGWRGHFSISNDEESAKFASKVMGEMDIFKLASNDDEYPFVLTKKKSMQILYRVIAPGVTLSQNQGTLKSYMYNYLGVPIADTLEVSKKRSFEERERVYLLWLQKIIEKFKADS